MTQRRAKKTIEPKSIYPKSIQQMLRKAHAKGLKSKQVARKINESKMAMKLGVSYTHRQIATTLGNLTRNYCYWA